MQSGDLQRVLEEIAAKDGGVLKPERVVEAAAAPDHPLHDRFEWDDAKAGHAHRVDQARRLIKSVRVEFTVEKRRIETVFYVRDPELPVGESGYRALPRLLSDRDRAAALIADEFARAQAVLGRARDIAEVLGMQEDVDYVMSQIRRLSSMLPAIKAA